MSLRREQFENEAGQKNGAAPHGDGGQLVADLEIAFRALGQLVHDEYPETCSLAEIVETWGDSGVRSSIDAIRRLIGRYGDPRSVSA